MVDAFGPDKRAKDGLQSRCRDCQNKIRRERYANNIEYRSREKERQKKYNKYHLLRALSDVANFSDTYVIAALKRGTSLTTKEIREHPDLIESQRVIMKIRRKIKKWQQERK